MTLYEIPDDDFKKIKEVIKEYACDICEESYSGDYSRGTPCNNGEECLSLIFNGKAKADAEKELIKANGEASQPYVNRLAKIQRLQKYIPEPYRTIICNIIANDSMDVSETDEEILEQLKKELGE